jgi:hypothetical protein
MEERRLMSNSQQPTRCLRCGRHLRAASSIEAGYGRTCRAKIRAAAQAAALVDFTPAQVAKAAELIADGGLVPTNRVGVYRSVGSDGVTIYLTHSAGCSCTAGLRDRLCYHRCAVRMVEATRKAA